MEEQPKDSPAKAFLKGLWSEVLWKAKRDPTKETFDELDAFIENHHAFFEAGILEPFSYEKLFAQHFPRCYARIKHRVKDWRENFLSTCEEAYRDKDGVDPEGNQEQEENYQKKRHVFLAVKNNDQDSIRHLIKTGQLTQIFTDGSSLSVSDRVEHQSLIECLQKSHSQESANIIFEELIVPSVRANEDLLCGAIEMHQSLNVIQQYCEKVDMTHISSADSWVEFACFHGHPEVGLFFARTYSLPLTVSDLRGICMDGDLNSLKVAMEQFKSFELYEYSELVQEAAEKGHENVVRYLIENAKKFNLTVEDMDSEKWVALAGKAGEFNMVTYLFEHLNLTFEPYILDALMREAVDGLKSRKDGDLRVINFLLEKGASFPNLLSMFPGPRGRKIIKKLIEEFRPESVIAIYRQLLHEVAERYAEAADNNPEVYSLRVMVKAFDDPTPENVTALNSERVKNGVKENEGLRSYYEDVVKPFANSFMPIAVSAPEKQEAHSSRAESIIDQFVEHEKVVPVTPQNIDAVTLENTTKWEWAELLRAAMRHPTTENWKAVHAFKVKVEARDAQGFGYDEELIAKCNALYEKCKGYEASPLMVPGKTGMGRDALRHVFFKLPSANRKAVQLVSKTHKGIIDNLDERTFAYMYPIEYEKVVAEKGHKIDWKAELKRVDKIVNTDPDDGFEALFRAVRDPSRDIEKIKENLAGHEGHQGVPLTDRKDALEKTTVCQCARRNGFKEALAAIFKAYEERVEADAKYLFTVAIVCYQPLEVLEKYYAKLDREDAAFSQSCRQAFRKAIAVGNLEAVKFLDGKNVVEINSPLLAWACEQRSVDIAWYLIAQGLDGRELQPNARDTLLKLTFEKDEKFQQKARAILCDRLRACATAFFVAHEKKPVLEIDSTMTENELKKAKREFEKEVKEFHEREKQNESKRALYAALQALLKVLTDPHSEEYQKALEDHKAQFESEALKPLYELCKPFLTPKELSPGLKYAPFPEDVPLPPSPPSSPVSPKK